MQSAKSSQEDNLGFLQSYKTEDEIFSLSSGEQVSIQKYFLQFNQWTGEPIPFDFGRKPILDDNGEPVFAELAILRLFLNSGFEGVWVETYGGVHYLRSMPKNWSLKSEHISIPTEKENILKRIWDKGKTRACFDVVIWKDDKIYFCEAKRSKKDRLTDAQKRFIEGALSLGISIESFLIIEWDFY